jgi:hypothetical protein
MAINLDYSNVEELVFENKRVMASLPQYKHLFDSWSLSKRVPTLKNLGQRSLLDFLESVTEDDVEIISIVTNKDVVFQELNLQIYFDIKSKLENLENELSSVSNILDMCAYRNKNEVKVFLWK